MNMMQYTILNTEFHPLEYFIIETISQQKPIVMASEGHS